jgi:hypothetical protein
MSKEQDIPRFEDGWDRMQKVIDDSGKPTVQMTPEQFKSLMHQFWMGGEKSKSLRVQRMFANMDKMSGLDRIPAMKQSLDVMMKMVDNV